MRGGPGGSWDWNWWIRQRIFGEWIFRAEVAGQRLEIGNRVAARLWPREIFLDGTAARASAGRGGELRIGVWLRWGVRLGRRTLRDRPHDAGLKPRRYRGKKK